MHSSKQTKECLLCYSNISVPNYNRHMQKCNGQGTCKHKEIVKKAENKNKSYMCRLCDKVFTTAQALTGHTQRSHILRDKQSGYGKLGSGLGGFAKGAFTHSNETKDRLSILACKRIAKHSKYSKNTEYSPGVILESSYEVSVAKILDELGIEWIKVRQGYIWDDNGKKRRYIPDFYLPKQNIFLDPKNDYLIKKDKRKIESAMKINNIRVVILSKELINTEFLELLVL